MYCKIHDVFWDYRDSWYCPICMMIYSDQLEERLKEFLGETKLKLNEKLDDGNE